jgi:hypothetical protein
MKEAFADVLAVGGKTNSLGRAHEVIEAVLGDKALLKELYKCLSHEDVWVRMRAADSLEKVCRIHPDWLEPYVDRLSKDIASSGQASLQWHLAQIYREVSLTAEQKCLAISWLRGLLSSVQVDWIVAANAMDTLAQFVNDGSVSKTDFIDLLNIQLRHKSNAVVKRANKLLNVVA